MGKRKNTSDEKRARQLEADLQTIRLAWTMIQDRDVFIQVCDLVKEARDLIDKQAATYWENL